MDDWITYLEAEPESEPFLSIAAAWKADKARLASVERERDEIMAMAERREDALRARLAHAEACLAEKHLRLAEVDKTLRPLVDDDNRPVEALARYVVARLAEAEALLREARAGVKNSAVQFGYPYTEYVDRIDAFLAPADSASVEGEK